MLGNNKSSQGKNKRFSEFSRNSVLRVINTNGYRGISPLEYSLSGTTKNFNSSQSAKVSRIQSK